ncbi:hypothetical protein, partial [Candidatus Uabimicrobium amorphum]|uniref:hypothetical protein n=1 Tax=Uabimicrobium amorphum TaxID=2596890 RepID=UPI0034A225E8
TNKRITFFSLKLKNYLAGVIPDLIRDPGAYNLILFCGFLVKPGMTRLCKSLLRKLLHLSLTGMCFRRDDTRTEQIF